MFVDKRKVKQNKVSDGGEGFQVYDVNLNIKKQSK